ncbi:hypothetical protein CRYO30217_03489 [Parvicella tangerina]|uniref:Lipoprotein n=2 Tax=Parvicella tangerina TaxID=2829795 RepID=A0A916JQZ0_9FLAO|nr:hypothetical protein CRYO30217_03489 [Parvicella tangerina]
MNIKLFLLSIFIIFSFSCKANRDSTLMKNTLKYEYYLSKCNVDSVLPYINSEALLKNKYKNRFLKNLMKITSKNWDETYIIIEQGNCNLITNKLDHSGQEVEALDTSNFYLSDFEFKYHKRRIVVKNNKLNRIYIFNIAFEITRVKYLK